MSRSNRTDLPNPAAKFFEWSPAAGELRYYDKELGENVAVPTPFSFMVLEDMAMVGGGVKRNGVFEGFWSNAVRSTETKVRPFVVRSKQGIEAEGLYADLKDRKGFSYVKGLYIAYREGDGPLQIGHLKLKGSAVGAWFDFLKTHKDIYAGALTIKGPSEAIKGEKGDYYTPVFAQNSKITAESDEQATALDETVLQPYLNLYLSQSGVKSEQAHAATAGGGDAFYDDEPEMPPMFSGEPNDDEVPF